MLTAACECLVRCLVTVLVSSQSITTVIVSKCGPLMWATLAATTNFTTTMTGGWNPIGHDLEMASHITRQHLRISPCHMARKTMENLPGSPIHRPKTPCRADETQKSCASIDSAAGQKLKPQMFWLQRGDRRLIHSKILNKSNQNTGDFKQNLGISSQQTLGNLN